MTAPEIQLLPDFIPQPQLLFDWLSSSVVWDERMRSRQTASYGVAYNYSQMHYAAQPLPPELAAICGRLNQVLGFEPNNCLLNHYPDGDSAMGFHSDAIEQLAPATGVAIVSLGGVRSIVFRHKQDKSRQFEFELTPGSLLYMKREIQADWLHAIPRVALAGARISLTFRLLLA